MELHDTKRPQNHLYTFTLQTLFVSGAPVVIYFQSVSGYSVQEKREERPIFSKADERKMNKQKH